MTISLASSDQKITACPIRPLAESSTASKEEVLVLTVLSTKKHEENKSVSTFVEKPVTCLQKSLREKIILTAKIATVALSTLFLLGSAVALTCVALPMSASTGLALWTGIALLGSASGLTISAIITPILAIGDSFAPEFADAPMYRLTQHNFKDWGIFLGTTTVNGIIGASFVPSLLAVSSLVIIGTLAWVQSQIDPYDLSNFSDT